VVIIPRRKRQQEHFMNNQEPEFNPVPTETDSPKTNESIQTSGSEIPADERPSYLRSRQIALKKFTSQGGAASPS
jgi:hypothetical protein